MKLRLYAFCISTILDKKKLEEFGPEGSILTEEKAWKTGKALLDAAKEAEMPVIFSDAAHDAETLIYWAILREIKIRVFEPPFDSIALRKFKGNTDGKNWF